MHRRPLAALSLALALLAAGAAGQVVRLVPQDFETIQAAVNAAQDNDQIVISGGTYHESVTMTGKSFVSFTAKGKVVIAPDAGAGLTLDGCTGSFIQGLRVQAPETYGFLFLDTTNCMIFKCSVTDAGLDGVRVEGGGTLTFEKVTVTDAALDGFALGSGVPDFTDNNLIIVCKIIRPGVDGVGINGSNNHVDTCKIVEAGRDGVNVDEPAAVLGSFVKDTKITKPGRHGIALNGDGCHVTGCKITAPVAHGIFSNIGSDGFIQESKLSKCGNSGVLVLGDGFHISDCKVTKPVNVGVDVGGDGVEVTGCKVTGAGNDGFEIEGDDGTWTGNTSSKAADDGFELLGMGNTLSGNVGKGSKSFDLSDEGSGPNTVDETNSFGTTGP